ncbi:hypothetical protein ACFVAD_19035 [Sutcliffiella sp. NPDC057660]|uniref:hypothetical protein n=1 Tax=Sutcliffiella sp. NPDC057660 TaxID=3346199 RepID=UPI0036AD0AE2
MKLQKMKMLILAGVVATSIAVPNAASADTAYNTTLNPGQTKTIATEAIWADAELIGTQYPVYSTGNCGVQYIVVDSSGNVKAQKTSYVEGQVNFYLDLNAIGQTFAVKAKNVYNGAKDFIKLVGNLFD